MGEIDTELGALAIADGPSFDDNEGEDQLVLPGGFSPVKFDTSSRRIRDLHSDYKDGSLNPSPGFQRGYVWDRQTASRLIESVLLNVPLPLVYTAETGDDEEVVIDGQQRLRTFFGYLDNRFPNGDGRFALGGLKIKHELNGKTYDQLDKNTQKALKTYNIQVIKISHDSDPDVKFEIFERLNSGSVKLNAQELRNCIYRGKMNDLISRLADDETFSGLIGARQKSRMNDVELVLRFFAFSKQTYLNYNNSMKKFLNNFMEDNRNIEGNSAKLLEDKFRCAVDLSFSVFGDQAFKRISRGTENKPNANWERALNRAIFDVVMWGFSIFSKNQIMEKKDEIREALISLMLDNDEFLDCIVSATGDKQRVQRRFEIWKSALDRIVSSQQQRSFSTELRYEMYSQKPICGICGNKIEHFDDAEVDHIIPFSAGGSTETANAQLTHRYCNRMKSSRVYGVST